MRPPRPGGAPYLAPTISQVFQPPKPTRSDTRGYALIARRAHLRTDLNALREGGFQAAGCETQARLTTFALIAAAPWSSRSTRVPARLKGAPSASLTAWMPPRAPALGPIR